MATRRVRRANRAAFQSKALTPRQEQIARLLRKGWTQAAVAVRLGIHVRTVEHHTAQIRRKRGAATTIAALYPGQIKEIEAARAAAPPEISVSPRMRFQVLARDDFTCQYCGRKAPDVELHVDHVIPRAKGGLTVLENLTTACSDCNRGKGDVLVGPVGSGSV